MIVRLSYFLFLTYVFIRTYLAIKCHFIKKDFVRWHYEREQDASMEECFKNEECLILDMTTSKKLWNEHPRTKELLIKEITWRKLYINDTRLKRIGSLILGCASLIGIWINYQGEVQQSSIYLALLPGIIGTFNTAFEWAEVKLPSELHEMIIPW